ncbi:protein of unknown function [Burkholderia multivorans]
MPAARSCSRCISHAPGPRARSARRDRSRCCSCGCISPPPCCCSARNSRRHAAPRGRPPPTRPEKPASPATRRRLAGPRHAARSRRCACPRAPVRANRINTVSFQCPSAFILPSRPMRTPSRTTSRRIGRYRTIAADPVRVQTEHRRSQQSQRSNCQLFQISEQSLTSLKSKGFFVLCCFGDTLFFELSCTHSTALFSNPQQITIDSRGETQQ